MGLKQHVLVLFIASSIFLSGCTFPVQENNEDVQNTEEENEIESIDLFPELFVEDTQVGFSEFARLNGTIVDEYPSKVTIYITLMPLDGVNNELEAIPPFNAKADGTWTRALPIYDPGAWTIGVYATDINQQSTDTKYITLEMLKPDEGVPTIKDEIIEGEAVA